MTVVDLIGFFAFATNVVGNLMLAWQTIWGWVVRLVSIIAWFVYGYNDASPPVIANAVTFFFINLFGLWKWRRESLAKQCKVCGTTKRSKLECPSHG